MRCVIACLLVACASRPVPRPPPPTPPPSEAPAVVAPEPAASDDSIIDPRFVLDTSVKTVWGVRPQPEEVPPEVAEQRAEDARIASPAARPRQPGQRAPCFAKRDVLLASEIRADLIDHAIWMGVDDYPPPKPRRYGTCRVRDHKVFDAKGTLVAELHCGVTLHAPGIIDHEGFEVGAHGKDILAAHPGKEPRCFINGERTTGCAYPDDGSGWIIYDIAALLPDGTSARDFLAQHTVAQITERMTCH